MNRMMLAGLIALLGLVGGAQAQVPGCSTCPTAGAFANARPQGWYGPQGPFGCNGFCLKFFGSTFQDGPLVNYGPYEGYYPFAPYGPWTSDLRYTGPTTRLPHGGSFNPACNSGRCGGGLNLGGRLGGGCNTCGGGLNLGGRLAGCGTCGGGFQHSSGCGGGCGPQLGGLVTGLLHREKECGQYALCTWRNIFHRVKPSCGGCGY